jgi:ABC-type multidrug transport system permease subunit
MNKFRVFVTTYSPMFALFAAIIGIYAMAIVIGCGLSLPV